MKITKLTTHRVSPRWMSLEPRTHEDVTGRSEPVEGRARTAEAAAHDVSEQLVGHDHACINARWRAMYHGSSCHGRFYRGGPGVAKG
jgi:galactonate dehydratase